MMVAGIVLIVLVILLAAVGLAWSAKAAAFRREHDEWAARSDDGKGQG